MTAIARFSVVALDTSDTVGLANFYSAITGWEVAPYESTEWIELVSDGGPTLAFQEVTDHVPPVWPGSEHPQQEHLDFDVTDLDEGERAVLEIGARKAEYQPGETFRVFLDPSGHPFCLVLV
ncbi:MAG TPA: VOC family protein [Acidimicrobiia bacterium]|nr:VOC family protein [Acidimicrobiia bacterium]